MRMLTILLIVILVAAGAYFAWKHFMPAASKDYPDVGDLRQPPAFIPTGHTPENLPQAPMGRE